MVSASLASSLESGVEDVIFGLANTKRLREAAFKLIYEAYLRGGLCPPNPFGMRVTPYQLLPSTDIFIGTAREESIGSISLIGDGRLGLPMESTFSDEVEARRRQGLYVGEVSCLADRREDFHRSFPVFIQLCRWMVQTARHRGMHQILAVVHPRHVRFYRRYMNFEVISGERRYATVCGNPGVAMCLDFERIDRDPPISYNHFFATPIPVGLLAPCPMSQSERQHFARVSQFADLKVPAAGVNVAVGSDSPNFSFALQ